MRRASIIGALLGLTALTALVLWQGVDLLAQTFAELGWRILWLPLIYLIPLGSALLSWRYLFPRGKAPSLGLCAYGIWINFAVNWLLPVAQVGGELVRIRLLIQRQFAAPLAIASIVADQTLQLVSQAVYGLVGMLLLVYSQVGSDQSGQMWAAVGLSLVVLIGISGGFYWLQHRGLFRLFSRIARKFPRLFNAPPGQSIDAQAQAIDRALHELYRRRDRLLIASLWRIAFRVAAAAETWLVLYLLGLSPSVTEALILESLGQAVRSAAFLIPGGLGAQEGGLMVVGAALGLPPTVGLFLSLCKRVRELILGVPGLLTLQLEQGWQMLRVSQRD